VDWEFDDQCEVSAPSPNWNPPVSSLSTRTIVTISENDRGQGTGHYISSLNTMIPTVIFLSQVKTLPS